MAKRRKRTPITLGVFTVVGILGASLYTKRRLVRWEQGQVSGDLQMAA
jgi:hypothetical protein